MRCVALLMLGAVMTARADTYVYVSMAPEQTIRVYKQDPKDGSLKEVQSLKVDGAPGCLMPNADGSYLFASLRTTSKLASYAIDRMTGKLTAINSVELPKGANAAFVTPDPVGDRLVSASYAGGTVVVHPLDGGRIRDDKVTTVKTAKTAHCVAFGRWHNFYVPHVGPNAVYEFVLEPETGVVSKTREIPGGAPKAGPRHIALHPRGDLAFTSDETGNSVTMYHISTSGKMKPVQTLSTLPDGYEGSNTTAEVKLSPGGRTIWVSNRGHDSIARFELDENDRMMARGRWQTEKTPRSFDIDADGRWLFVAGEGSGKLAVYHLDPMTGVPLPRHTVDVGKSLTWVKAISFDGHAMREAVLTPESLKWKDGPATLPKGARSVVLEGDPTQPGPFVLRIELPDGMKIMPHTHPKDERVTVISGTLFLGTGAKFDAKACKEMPAGSYGRTPGGMAHFGYAKGKTVLQLHGEGPWTIEYLDPADDPRKK